MAEKGIEFTLRIKDDGSATINKVGGSIKGMSGEIKHADKATRDFGKSMLQLGAAVVGLLAIRKAFREIKETLIESIAAANKQEDAINKLSAV